MQLGRGRENDFSRGLFAYEFIFFLLGDGKYDIRDVAKAKFQVVACSCEVIFCSLNDTKCKLGMVLEAIFQQVDKPYELIK
jgi:hypothetical protein